jgi:hypothetical protein
LEHCKAIQQWEREGRWPAIFGTYLTALRAAHPVGGLAATREYVKILALYAEPAGAALPVALKQALALRCFSLEAVKLLLYQQCHASPPREPFVLSTQPQLAALARVNPPPPNLGVYEQLLEKREGGIALVSAGRGGE